MVGYPHGSVLFGWPFGRLGMNSGYRRWTRQVRPLYLHMRTKSVKSKSTTRCSVLPLSLLSISLFHVGRHSYCTHQSMG